MKYKTILALSLTAMLTVGVMITGCGNKTDNSTNTTDNGNTATDKLKESADKAGDAVKDLKDSDSFVFLFQTPVM